MARLADAGVCMKCAQTRSKRYLEIQKLRESKKEYDVPMALSLMKQVANTRFVESAEAHFRMNLDPKYNDQQLRATVPYHFFYHLISSLALCLFVLSSVSLIWIRAGQFAQGDGTDRQNCSSHPR
jgi:hypothetical protein